ncbi:MAG TPA: hypothetical protein VGB50_10915 [Flavobacterium sp.]|jgi:hypothetical protein
MKKLWGIVLLSALLGCDDGDMTVETLNFDDVAVQRCDNNESDILYKLTDTEALIVEFNELDEALVNDPGTVNITISGTNRVVYRAYNGNVGEENICGTIPPANPTVDEEWTATSGIIEITTTAIREDNPDIEGGELITEYRHVITFRNITFQKPNGTQLYETFPFGTLDVAFGSQFFNFHIFNPENAGRCGNTVYNFSGSEGIALNIDPALIQNEVTPLGSPRTGLISNTTNSLNYRIFGGLVSAGYFCADPPPATPTITETWIAEAGVEAVSGIVEVYTTTNSPGVFTHEIHLRNVILRKGNSAFRLADDFVFARLTN